MGLEVDPDFANNHRIYTCQGGFTGGGHDVHVIAWTLDDKLRKATDGQGAGRRLPDQLGPARRLPARSSPATARCCVGTGDAAQGTNPRGPRLARRQDAAAGPVHRRAVAEQPVRRRVRTHARYVHTYGHRNVQGLAERADGTLWSIEQGTDRDDEVNLLVNGGDYG